MGLERKMSGELWKYCGKEQEKAFILSLNLLPASMRERLSGEAQRAVLYVMTTLVQQH